MKKTKLLQVLETLSEEEMKLFESFLNCYMFNPRSVKVTELFKAIAAYHPGYSSEDFTKMKIWENVYPTKRYNDVVMRNLISDLYGHLKNFLAHQRLKQDTIELNKSLCQELFSRGLYDIANSEIDKIEKHIDDNIRTADSRYLDKYILDCIRHVNESRHSEYDEYKWEEEKTKYLIHYFLKEMFSYYSNFHTLKTFIKTEYDMVLFDEVMTFADMNYNKLEPQIQILFNATVILIYPHREDVFEKTFQMIKEKGQECERLIHYNILTALENYCINMYNSGNLLYLPKLREVHIEKIKQGLLMPVENSDIPEPTFTNIVKTAIRCKEYEWVEEFVRKNFHMVEQNEEDMFNYYLAYIYHAKGENEKALEYLSQMKSRDLMEKINLRNLEIKIYFDLGYYDNVLMTAENYKKFFSGHKKVSDLRKNGNMNFISYTLKILRASEKNDKIALGVLAEKIKKAEKLSEKDWLLERIENRIT